MRLNLLVLDDVFDIGLATVLDAFGTANSLAQQMPAPAPHFEVRLVGPRAEVTTALGMRVTVQPLGGGEQPDWIVVPALRTQTPEKLLASFERADVVEALASLRHWHGAGVRVAAACIGTFLLAESGLLDGEESTTSWFLGPFFRQRYPQVRLSESRMLVPSGTVVTAGAALGHLDLALWLIRQSSPDLAAMVARYLVVDARPSQAPYVIPDHLARADPLVARFERWSRGRLAQGFSLDDAADALATSKRTLQRRIEAVLGKSPLAYFQDLRVEHAVHLLRTDRLDIESIAARVGYADGATLRTLLRRRLGRGVRELRGEKRE